MKSLTQPDVYMLHNIFPPNDVDTLQKVRVCVPWNNSMYHFRVCSGYFFVRISRCDVITVLLYDSVKIELIDSTVNPLISGHLQGSKSSEVSAF